MYAGPGYFLSSNVPCSEVVSSCHLPVDPVSVVTWRSEQLTLLLSLRGKGTLECPGVTCCPHKNICGPYAATKPSHYYGCQKVLADRNPIWVSPERLSRALVTQIWMLAANHWIEHGDPNGGVRGRTEVAERVCNPIGRTTTSTNQTPRAPRD